MLYRYESVITLTDRKKSIFHFNSFFAIKYCFICDTNVVLLFKNCFCHNIDQNFFLGKPAIRSTDWFHLIPKESCSNRKEFLETRNAEKYYFHSNEGNTITLVLVMVSSQNLQQWRLSTEEDHMQGYAEYSL